MRMSLTETAVHFQLRRLTRGIDRNGKPLPFLSKYKITKSEMEKVINVSDGVVVYLTERDGLKARQIILDHYKEIHDYYKNHMEKYQSYIDNLTGRNANA